MRRMVDLLVALTTLTHSSAEAADPPAAKPRPLARLLFQDHAARAVKWADAAVAADGGVTLGPVADVAGFPKLDASRQTLVQMRLLDGRVLVGVRNDDDGQFGSGWVMVGTGVRHTDHGDHAHWNFKRPPVTIGARVDADQGNPAHLYAYGGKFYLANDQKGGYSRFDPAAFPKVADPDAGTRPQFIPGGGGHITLAVVDDQVGYGCWIDGDEANKGRVDVTPIRFTGAPTVAYSFALPTGGIHGATACAGKVFFAPAAGVCWVAADLGAALKPNQVQVHHVPLGTDGDKPLRTGAFAAHGRHVLCVTGTGAGAKLVVLDAAAADPKPVFVTLSGGPPHKPVAPDVVLANGTAPHALVFHDHDPKTPATDRLDVVALDPNGDGSYADAKVVKSLEVGPSAVDGHHGHHGVAFDARGEFAFVTNPGAGTVTVLNLTKLEVVATVPVGGTPTAIVAHGGRDGGD